MKVVRIMLKKINIVILCGISLLTVALTTARIAEATVATTGPCQDEGSNLCDTEPCTTAESEVVGTFCGGTPAGCCEFKRFKITCKKLLFDEEGLPVFVACGEKFFNQKIAGPYPNKACSGGMHPPGSTVDLCFSVNEP